MEDRGYEVLTLWDAETPEQLFESVDSFRPDVIFTDHDMPGVKGEEIIRMLKQVPQFGKPLKVDDLMRLVTKLSGTF